MWLESIIWNSSIEPSIGVEWLDVGQGSISIVQYYGLNETCVITLDVTVIPSTIDLQESINRISSIIVITDILGMSVYKQNPGAYILHIYDDGSVKKLYQLNNN